jgi:hypothetical protein
MLTIIPGVVVRRIIQIRELGWLDGRRARTRYNFPANRDYVDLRGLALADLDAVLAEERSGYALLDSAGYTQSAIDLVDRKREEAAVVPMLDFGIASTVVALSVLGCVPITSCRGRSLGKQVHAHPAPMTTFYARKTQAPVLLTAVERADIYVVNSGAKLEVYSEDIRKMHAFAVALRGAICEGATPQSRS